jgi:hypothetical protein
MQKGRRIMLMMGTILVGIALVLLDAPLPLILLGTVSMGTMMLVLLGAKETPPAAAAPEERKGEPAPTLRQRMGARFSKKSGRKIPEQRRKPGIRTRISAAVTSSLALFRRSSADDERVREIDALLEMAIRESVSPLDQELATGNIDGEPPENHVSSAKAEFKRELAELGSFEFDDDLDLAPGDEKTESYEKTAAFEDEAAAAEIPGPGAGEEFAFEMDASFPGMEEEEDGISLEGLDIPGFDFEDAPSLDAIAQDIPVIEEEEADITPAPVEEEPSLAAPEAKSGEKLNLDFSDDGDSEIMDILRSESKKKVHVQDLSLLRAMKDVQVNAVELSAELEEVLGLIERKIRRSDGGA